MKNSIKYEDEYYIFIVNLDEYRLLFRKVDSELGEADGDDGPDLVIHIDNLDLYKD